MSDIVVFVRSQPRFGDQIVAFPTLYLLKQWWPDRRVRVVSRYEVGDYYTCLPWVDEFIRADAFGEQLRALPARASASLTLHHTSERFALINLLRRPALRVGFKNRRVGDCVWTHSHTKDIREYIGLANLRLLETLRGHDAHSTARQCFTQIAKLCVDKTKPADIVLIPGGGAGEFKRWSLDHYVALAGMIRARLGGAAQFTFVLGPDEAAERDRLERMQRPDFRVEFCRPVADLAALMQDARLIVSNDCGPSHIAQGVCVPYVGVFNEPNPEWFWAREYARDVVPEVLSAGINSIHPERVLEACMAVLDAPRPRPAYAHRVG
ncbi:glycosyltransferase family 9 protein [Achromobacter sp.]|uniref:glycosyltransferase family 9 protein n=1 Tax=Achromobacter sp. TaxID=134375 RepID=UPI0028AF7D66|nr:glycosyltransferase family 9 protein [Achromobacter sp.]